MSQSDRFVSLSYMKQMIGFQTHRLPEQLQQQGATKNSPLLSVRKAWACSGCAVSRISKKSEHSGRVFCQIGSLSLCSQFGSESEAAGESKHTLTGGKHTRFPLREIKGEKTYMCRRTNAGEVIAFLFLREMLAWRGSRGFLFYPLATKLFFNIVCTYKKSSAECWTSDKLGSQIWPRYGF